MSKEQQQNPVLTVKPSQATSCIIKAIKAKRVPMLHGSPGIGKSDIVHGIAAQFGLKVIDLRLSQCDPTDLLGFPSIDKVANKAGYVPMETFPIKGDALPWIDDKDHSKGQYKGWLLFLDELTSAPPAVQAAAYKLILDRMVGVHHLHSNCVMVGAGNQESDNAVVHAMSTALQSRMVHLVLQMDVKEWLAWAIDHKVDHRITDFIQFKPANLYTFSADHTDKTYASPRTWFFNDSLLKVCGSDVKDPDFLPLSTGSVTEGVTREFLIFCDIYTQLPSISQIIANPLGTSVPEEPSIRFALSGSIGNHASPANVDKLLPYILRLPIEFQVVTLRYMLRLKAIDISHPVMVDWIVNHGATLF